MSSLLCASDLGVEIVLESCAAEAWCTRLVVRIIEAPFAYGITSARLLPSCDGDDHEETLPLVAVRSVEDATELLFGALPLDTTTLTLHITRLRVNAETDTPFPAAYDPFDPLDAASEREACLRFLEAEDAARDLPPEWECRGLWSFTLSPTPRDATRARIVLPVLETLGACALAVPWVHPDPHATLLAVDVIARPWISWGALWKEAALRETSERVPVPAARIAIRQGSTAWPSHPLGPYNRLGTRLYFEGPPLAFDGEPIEVALESLQNVPLTPPVEHTFPAHSFERNAEIGVPLAAAGLDGTLRLTLHDVYGNDALFLLLYRTQLTAADLLGAWISDASLIDADGVEHVCQEDGVQPLREFGLTAPPSVRAMRFGGIRADRPVTLRIRALDLTFTDPRIVVAALPLPPA